MTGNWESDKHIRIGNRCKSTCIMHSQIWELISSTSHLPISSTLTEGRNLTCKSHWVSLDHLPIPSKAAKMSRTVNLRHFVICVSRKNCSYSKHKRHKLFSSQEGNGETVPDAEDPILSGLADEEVDKLLKSEENQALLKDLGSAMQRVDSARKELDDIEEREKGAAELRAYIQRLEGADSVEMDSDLPDYLLDNPDIYVAAPRISKDC